MIFFLVVVVGSTNNNGWERINCRRRLQSFCGYSAQHNRKKFETHGFNQAKQLVWNFELTAVL